MKQLPVSICAKQMRIYIQFLVSPKSLHTHVVKDKHTGQGNWNSSSLNSIKGNSLRNLALGYGSGPKGGPWACQRSVTTIHLHHS